MPRFTVLASLPSVLDGWRASGVIGRAVAAGRMDLDVRNLRDWATDRHRSIDDSPYGGGPGMVLRADVVVAAAEALRTPATDVLLLSPAGERFDHRMATATAERMAGGRDLLLVAARYEGVDERAVEILAPRLVSIGDYVLSGGEVAAAVVVEAVARHLPGVLGAGEEALAEESFSGGHLEYPQYTRPEVFRGLAVPEILRSGDHARIRAWRAEAGRERTRRLRPDLLESEGERR